MTELMIPVDLKALCISKTEVDDNATKDFSGATTDMTQLPYVGGDNEGKPFISSYDTILQTIRDTPVHPLEPGVHLHWALPHAMTHGRVADKRLKFPQVPNRWLVTRFWLKEGTPQLKSWVVESDHLSGEGEGAGRVSLAVKETEAVPFRMIGRSVPLEDWQSNRQGERLQDLIGENLTAVSSGEPIFAAYYPNCMNVFGLHDDLEDVPNQATVKYSTISWYSDPADDPLQEGLTLAAVEKQMQWTVGEEAGSDTIVQHSVFHGSTQGVDWHPDTPYLTDLTEIPAELSIGNNVAEALSAWASQDLEGEERNTLEDLLTAFQLGLFSDFNSQNLDRLPDLQDALHEAGFAAHGEGTLWTVKPIDTTPKNTISLPPEQEAKLSELNGLQRQVEVATKKVNSLREQLYADWNRYGLALLDEQHDDTDDAIGSNNIGVYLNQEIKYLFGDGTDTPIAELQALTDELKAMETSLGNELQPLGFLLEATAAPRRQVSSEPTLLLTGEMLGHRYDDLKKKDLLQCRLSSSALSSLTISGSSVSESDFQVNWPTHAEIGHPEVVQELLVESCLLDSNFLKNLLNLSIDPEDLEKFLAEGVTSIVTDHVGSVPAFKATQFWDKNPWLPLFLEWRVDFHPTESVEGEVDYSADVIAQNFDRELHDFIPHEVPESPDEAPDTYVGHSILTPLATQSLENALENIPSGSLGDLEDDLQGLLEELQKTPMVFQALSGLNQAMKMRERALQLPIRFSPSGEEKSLDESVHGAVQGFNTFAPRPNSSFNPLRAGFMRLTLNVVDLFGQKREIDYGQNDPSVETKSFSCAHTMRAGNTEANHQVYLPPRLMQEGQLVFRYGNAETGDTVSNPVMDPVCGWILPNHLQNTLMFYDASHLPIGEFFISENEIQWNPAPGTTPGSVEEAFAEANPFLRDFAVSLDQKTPQAFAAFFESVRVACDHVVPEVNRDPALSVLMGRPLALMNTSVQVSLPAYAPVDQSWKAFLEEYKDASASLETFTENRQTHGFHQIQLPIMVGEPLNEAGERNRVRDGLIGYFLQQSEDYDFSTFYTLKENAEQGIEGLPTHQVSAQDSEIPMLMLVDPRAKVHATSGVFPTKTLELPTERYNETLHALEVSFSIASVLQPAQDHDFTFPLPLQEGYEWSWIENQGNGNWLEEAITDNPPMDLYTYTPQAMHSGWLNLKKKPLEDQE